MDRIFLFVQPDAGYRFVLQVFTVVFILEMILKLVALGVRQYLKVTWNIFDGVIVIMSIVDMSMEFSNAGGAGGVLSVLRTFRLVSKQTADVCYRSASKLYGQQKPATYTHRNAAVASCQQAGTILCCIQ